MLKTPARTAETLAPQGEIALKQRAGSLTLSVWALFLQEKAGKDRKRTFPNP
jgi:hypothetical protein